MPMAPIDRKIELMRSHTTMSQIARDLGVTVQHVSAVVGDKRRSPSIERAVADAIGRDVEDVFPPLPAAPSAA